MICKRRLLIFSILVVLIFLSFVMYHYEATSYYSGPVLEKNTVTDEPVGDVRLRPGLKRILFWTPFWGYRDHVFGLGHAPFLEKGCDVTNCETTIDRRLLMDSDAVVFHWGDVVSHDMPAKRNVDQFWVMWNQEPVSYFERQDKYLDKKINWTMTYRMDSDVFAPYGEFVSLDTLNDGSSIYPKVISSEQMAAKKMKSKSDRLEIVSWLVSSCNTPGKRHLYVNELQKYIGIDVYGKCGNRVCPRGNRSVCTHVAYNNYKFYLAFENSLCTDYVTEKLYLVLNNGSAVPVVYGSANYSQIAPPHSYIDVNDFKSPRHLAEYLKMLDNNDDLYMEYHAWRSKYKVRILLHLCYLCTKLNSKVNHVRKFYSSFSNWWFRDDDCWQPSWKTTSVNATYNLLEERVEYLKKPKKSKGQ